MLYTYGLIEFNEGCQLTKCNEIIFNDHRGYLVDINLERYCDHKLNEYDKPRKVLLNHTRKSHMEKFNEKQIK